MNKFGTKPKVVNIVATGQFPCELDIKKLYCELDLEDMTYEPEIYPALLVKVGENRSHVTLYRNGKYIITGVTSKKELMEAYNNIYNLLKEAGAL